MLALGRDGVAADESLKVSPGEKDFDTVAPDGGDQFVFCKIIDGGLAQMEDSLNILDGEVIGLGGGNKLLFGHYLSLYAFNIIY